MWIWQCGLCVAAGSWPRFPECWRTSTTVWARSSLKLCWLFYPPTSSVTSRSPRTAFLHRPPHLRCPHTAWSQTAEIACRTCGVAQLLRGGEATNNVLVIEFLVLTTVIGFMFKPWCIYFVKFMSFFRSGMLTRHRSMTESSQSLRQIEMPKKTTRAVRLLFNNPYWHLC